MLNANGTLTAAYNELPNDLLKALHKVITVTELLRVEGRKAPFLGISLLQNHGCPEKAPICNSHELHHGFF